MCACGHLFEAPPGPATCPVCHQIHPLTLARISVQCLCGAELKAPGRMAGKMAKCPKCGEELLVPASEQVAMMSASLGAPEPPPRPAAPVSRVRSFLPYLFSVTLIPLAFTLFTKSDDVEVRLQRTFESNPEVVERLKKSEITSDEDLFDALPEHRLEGAFLPKDTWVHWGLAALAAGVLWGAILVLYPLGNATSGQLWKIGLFTGTLGILMLIGIQYVAEWTQGMIIVGRGLLTILFYILKFIGFSYRAALDPENGFILSMLGFTFGVGLCEELCKALPLIWHFRRKATLDMSGAVAWGLATGIGFGISEGIMYSSDFYNGVSTSGIYVVRFVSCVALHAVWSAATAVFIYRRQQDLRDVDSWWGWPIPVLKILAVSMILHGLYDTLLKRDLEVWAILTAAASFAWFFWFVRHSAAMEEPEPTGAPLAA